MLKVMPKIAVVLLSAMVRASVEVLHYALTDGYTKTAIDLVRSSNLREAGFTFEGQPLIVSAALSTPEAIPALVNAGADVNTRWENSQPFPMLLADASFRTR